MKKVVTITLLALLSLPVLANTAGGFTGSTTAETGGFKGPTVALTTVEMAKTLRDDAKVVLRGKIERHLGGENYLFSDSTGSITVDISSKKWNGQTISPQDQVEIQGEVDKDWNSVEIDVDRIIKQ